MAKNKDITEWTREEFENSVVAQDDDRDYQESGYVFCVKNEVAYVGRYSHCSCYGTFDAICGGGISSYLEKGTPTFEWQGTPNQLYKMSVNKLDPAFPEREALTEDYDYDHLMECYTQYIEWFKKNKTKKKKKKKVSK